MRSFSAARLSRRTPFLVLCRAYALHFLGKIVGCPGGRYLGHKHQRFPEKPDFRFADSQRVYDRVLIQNALFYTREGCRTRLKVKTMGIRSTPRLFTPPNGWRLRGGLRSIGRFVETADLLYWSWSTPGAGTGRSLGERRDELVGRCTHARPVG